VTALLEARDVSAGYGDRPVIQGVSLALQPGRTTGVVGPNAAGKSTLFRALVGLLPPSSGEVLLDGQPVMSLPARQRAIQVALVPQSVRYDLDFSVREMVAMGRAPHAEGWGIETAEDREAIEAALSALELESLRTRSFAELSGGERQRVLVARAVAQQAKVLLLDEPTAHLDLSHQLLVMEQIDAHRRRGGAALVVLHDLALAMRLDEVVVLGEGRVVAAGPPGAVLTRERLAQTWGIDATLEERDGVWALAMKGRTRRAGSS
jgi:iron complex transport system ATP-binding protein